MSSYDENAFVGFIPGFSILRDRLLVALFLFLLLSASFFFHLPIPGWPWRLGRELLITGSVVLVGKKNLEVRPIAVNKVSSNRGGRSLILIAPL